LASVSWLPANDQNPPMKSSRTFVSPLISPLLASLIAKSLAESPDRPALSIAKAASIAEAELTKRGLADKHYISSLYFIAGTNTRTAHYRASIVPPVPFDSPANEGEAPNYLQLRIEMNGSVTSEGFHMEESRRRIRVQ
jgi:hypothetical protein